MSSTPPPMPAIRPIARALFFNKATIGSRYLHFSFTVIKPILLKFELESVPNSASGYSAFVKLKVFDFAPETV